MQYEMPAPAHPRINGFVPLEWTFVRKSPDDWLTKLLTFGLADHPRAADRFTASQFPLSVCNKLEEVLQTWCNEGPHEDCTLPITAFIKPWRTRRKDEGVPPGKTQM